jgi:GNAT superfamily N-acetyltransferase
MALGSMVCKHAINEYFFIFLWKIMFMKSDVYIFHRKIIPYENGKIWYTFSHMGVVIDERAMSDEEYKRVLVAFEEHGKLFGNPPEVQERFGFVATENGKFVGASSGLAQKVGEQYGTYFYLSDLLVEKAWRKQGYGKKLVQLLEDKITSLGICYCWTWTAGYEAETFYLNQGYTVFTRFENFYPSGHARVGLIKKLS